MTETYVVTGGAGFIGSHLVTRLLAEGHAVRVVDNFSTGRQANLAHLNGVYTLHQSSVTDKAALLAAFDGADYVYHQAALPSVPRSVEDPLETHEQCATGTLNVLLAARDCGVRRVIYAASSSAYGDADNAHKEESLPPRPLSPYGVAKLTGEYYCQVFSQVYGLETVALRYFNVFGPRQDPNSKYSAVIPLFITAILEDRPPLINGDGLQSRDFTYIDNVVQGNLLAAKAPAANGQVINMATGGQISLLNLVEKINTLTGKAIQPIHGPERAGDIRHSSASIAKAQRLLGYAPQVDFDTGLARTLEWFR